VDAGAVVVADEAGVAVVAAPAGVSFFWSDFWSEVDVVEADDSLGGGFNLSE
jgi:hypothetical protein